ncbi:phage portal protein [Sphingomonas echinoides]|uniref:phage portal protein n=1 Tax=Sphingomonas echinoides TaxID=59803 RepID=UPI002413530C|nr:phage portal protein [Sphingomonas echinoides]
MRFLGFDFGRTKSVSPVDDRRGWFGIVRESFAGAWQENVEVKVESVLAYHAVFACMTLIASDISKLRVKLVAQSASGIWSETTRSSYSPVLRKPNPFQTRIQFWESYFLSKLARGNTYVLKRRDGRGIVTALYVLDPNRVKVLVSDEGEVFYELQADNLAGFTGQIAVPAREIIHDRFNCLFHPLVGLSPLFANGLAATQGLKIQNNSANFFGNQSRPGGILVAPGNIGKDTADELKDNWHANYSGKNAGKVAVLGNGMKYESIAVTPSDAKLIEQLKWTSEVVCSTFHVPPYKLGIGNLPTNSNVESLNLEYYTQALQSLIEAAELCLDEGLGIGEGFGIGTEFDLDGLLRMDTAALVEAESKAVGAGIKKIDEARLRLDLEPTEGGNTPYLQEQNYSLAALAKRDANADPFASKGTAVPTDPANDNAVAEQQARATIALFEKELREALNA